MKRIVIHTILMSGLAAATFSCAQQEEPGMEAMGNKLTVQAELVSSPVWATRATHDRMDYGTSAEIEDGRYVITAQKEEWNASNATTTEAEGNAPLTRGTPITSVSGIANMHVNIYNTEESNWTPAATNPATIIVTKNGNSYTTTPSYAWDKNATTKRSLFAYAPIPTSENGLSGTGYQVTYTVPTTVGNQPDFCTAEPLMDVVNDNGTKHLCSFKLHHRLTAVGFKMLGWNLKITKITVSGVAIQGTFDMSTLSWGSLSPTTESRSASVTESSFTHNHNSAYADITASDGYLMMIPQMLDDGATVTIDYTATDGNATSGTITAKLNDLGVTWTAGDKITYNIRLKTAPAVTNGDLRISNSQKYYSTSSPVSLAMDEKDILTFSWNEPWLKAYRGNPAAGTQPAGSGSPWEIGPGGPWGNIYFYTTNDNTSTTVERSALVTVTGTRSGTRTFYVKQAKLSTDYIKIGDLYWAKGNLVATNQGQGPQGEGGCKIGAPTDGGLYFQFGGLIGWRGGSDKYGMGTGMPNKPDGSYWQGTSYYWWREAMLWPKEMNALSSKPDFWPQITSNYYQWFFSAWEIQADIINVMIPSKAVGDPCTYFLGQKWRLPTKEEFDYLIHRGAKYEVKHNGVLGSWFGWSAGDPLTSIFFPAAGVRTREKGVFSGVKTEGVYWSKSTYYAMDAYILTTEYYGGSMGNVAYRDGAFPVRCVSPNP